MKLLSTGDADSVGDGLDSSESPARSAGALVANFPDGFTVRPCCSGEELIGDILDWLDFLERELEVLGGFKSSHELLDGLEIHAVEVFVVASSPALLDGVDMFDDLVEVKEDLLFKPCKGGHGQQAQYEHGDNLHNRFIINSADRSSFISPYHRNKGPLQKGDSKNRNVLFIAVAFPGLILYFR